MGYGRKHNRSNQIHRASCLTDLSKELEKGDDDTFLTSHTYSSSSGASMSSSDASGPMLQSYTCDDWGYFVDFVDYEKRAEQGATADRPKSDQLTQENQDGLVVSL
jgi:hypothetical protein